MKPLLIALCYDAREPYVAAGWSEEAACCFTSEKSAHLLEEGLAAGGHRVERLASGHLIARHLCAGRRWDLVFNYAEDFTQVPALCELYEQPYTFADPLASALCLNKALAKRVVRDVGVRTAPFVVVESAAEMADPPCPPPWWIKPIGEGNSIGVTKRSKVEDPEALRVIAAEWIEHYEQPVLVEEFLPGRELTVGILGTGAAAAVLGVMDIDFSRAVEDCGYTAVNKRQKKELLDFRLADDSIAREAAQQALLAHRVLRLRDAARLDFRVDRHGRPCFLEANALPGMKPTSSDLPALALLAGMQYPDLLARVVESALARRVRHRLVGPGLSRGVDRATEPVLELAVGAPDDGGPEDLRRAAAKAILDGENQYVSSRGTLAFREAVAQHVERFHGLRYAPDREIVQFTGGTEAIFASILGLTEPGDEVLYFSPWYETYRPATLAAGAVPRAIRLRLPGWTFDREDLERVAGPRTRLLILNDPHNPTGRVLTRRELDAIVSFCDDRGLLVVSDQVYEHLVYEGELTPIARYPQMRDRTVAISSTGKTFGLCGWKVGYACAPAPLAERILAVRKLITISSGGPFQSAMAHALAAEDRVFEEIRAAQRSRRDFLASALGDLGWKVLPAQAGLFLLFEVPDERFPDAPSFCRWLESSAGILVRPAAHEPDTEAPMGRLVRIAFCKRPETLRQAVDRLRQIVSLLSAI